MRTPKFKPSQSVVVVNEGELYSTYCEMAESMELKKYVKDFGSYCISEEQGRIIAIRGHGSDGRVLYGVHLPRHNKDIIIGEPGIELCKKQPVMLPEELFQL